MGPASHLPNPYGRAQPNQPNNNFRNVMAIFTLILAGQVIKSSFAGGGKKSRVRPTQTSLADMPDGRGKDYTRGIIEKSNGGGNNDPTGTPIGSTGNLRESTPKAPQTETESDTATNWEAYGEQYEEDYSIGEVKTEMRETDYLSIISPLVIVPSHRAEYANYKDDEVDPEVLLFDTKTPHGMAFDFILNRDKRKIASDDPQLVQRFVLTLLFYASGGEDASDPEEFSAESSGRHIAWNSGAAHFLSPLHECHWAKKSLNDQFWALLSTDEKDRRVGVTKCNESMEVTEIRLADVHMSGFLPDEIKWLSELTSLDLQGNHLAGPIPKGIGELTKLRYISFDGNNFSGSVPDVFEKLSTLEHAYLNFNDFNGAIPTSLCSLRDGGLLEDLWSDCGGYPVTCTCCTVCCNMVSECDEVASQKGT